ncbi:thiol reductant ABC exporter subunit CydD [Actinomadura fibrosa]|uniref:Thiol reductant ABC exporter subunit CydD n=1 Tax=Actinomadura fibrosa TaxID=111802 RepID=A0ABW2XT23_9ACTN|nr:thiol reductant ABC exporter subunit CydD [Actinomadura fibrosa]
MKPVDPRLLREAAPARRFLAGTVLLGAVTTALVVMQAVLLAHVLAAAFDGTVATAALIGLPAVVAARTLVAAGGESLATRASSLVKSRLRSRLAGRSLHTGGTADARPGDLVTLATRGLDALDPYFARYLPQLVLAIITPVAVLVVVARADLTSALVMAVTLPLIPVFMILVGLHTRARTERQWNLLERLGGHFLDVVQGLPTLKVFGRAQAQAAVIADVTAAHRRATMRTLRVAFLSALVLELLATLSVALVAVEVGLRLLDGGLPYETALLVLILAPEVYLPLRNVGAQFHASMEGATAAGRALDLLGDRPSDGHRSAPSIPARIPREPAQALWLSHVTVRYPDRTSPALDDVSLAVEPGERLVVIGPSGAGKSTLLAVILRFTRPESGDTGFAATPAADWRREIAWVPQDPHLFTGTVADNIRLGHPDADDAALRHAAALAGAASFIEALPEGYLTPVGENGSRLSSGQRRRIALARAFLRDAPILLLDEPTAHLDGIGAAELHDTLEHLMAGRTVVMVTHDHRWTGSADRVARLDAGRLTIGAPLEGELMTTAPLKVLS